METTHPPGLSSPRASGLAIASLITGLMGVFPAAIVLGHMAMSRIRRSAGQMTGFGMALAGTILGYVGLTLMLTLMAISFLFIGARAWKRGSDRAACILQTRTIQQAVRSHQVIKGLKPGDPMDWNEIFGPEGHLRQPTCPSGGDYTFVEAVPGVGILAASCSHEDHVPIGHDDW